MRGEQDRQVAMLLGVVADDLVPPDHPIRAMRRIVDGALRALSPTFDRMYAADGRPSIPPEHLLKSLVLIALYSIRSERQFCERLQYDLLFKWFLDLNIADSAFNPSTFSKNRERLLTHDAIRQFFAAVLAEARRRQLLSSDHFTVDGTLLEAWASVKSFKPKPPAPDAATPAATGGPSAAPTGAASAPPSGAAAPPAAGKAPATRGGRNPDVDFHGERRTNATHQSTTDPEARLAKKGPGKEAKLSFLGNVLMENRHGLVVDVETVQASGTGEVEAALRMLDRVGGDRRLTVGGDKNYDQHPFVDTCRSLNVTPHVAQKQHSAVDGRTTRHPGYATSQQLRKRVEEIFGWEKTVGGCRKLRFRGLRRVDQWFTLAAAAFNLVRMATLERSAAAA
jgi:transposase